MYIFGGPAEFMPEEGLTRSQRQLAAALEVRSPPPPGGYHRVLIIASLCARAYQRPAKFLHNRRRAKSHSVLPVRCL
jgi:hypothetical protein